MRREIERIQQTLTTFAAQHEQATLVVTCDSITASIASMMVDRVGQGTAQLSFVATEHFQSGAQFVNEVATRIRTVTDSARDEVLKQTGRVLPPFPENVMEQGRPPHERMRSLMQWTVQLRPQQDLTPVVWGLLPMQIEQATAWAAFVTALMQHELPLPWCAMVRVVVRDDRSQPTLAAALAQLQHAQWLDLDLGTESLARATERETQDETLPLEERMQNLLVLAGLDDSHRRYPAAIEKYQLAHRYYAHQQRHDLAAHALHGLSEVHSHAGDDRRARETLTQALVPAMQGEVWPVLLNIELSFGNLEVRARQWEEAALHYFNAAQIALQVKNVSIGVMALQRAGDCQVQRNDTRGALEHWNAGAAVARRMQEIDGLRGCLQRLESLFRAHQLRDELHTVEAELATLPPPTADAHAHHGGAA